MSEVKFTRHAEEMLKERKFEREFVIDVVLNPEWREEEEGDIWYAFRRVGERVV